MSKRKRSKFLTEIDEIDSPAKLIVTRKGSRTTYSFRGELANEFLKEYLDSTDSKKEDT